jgi:aspartate kinase
MLESGEVPLIGGYVGATADGETTTLGRGGSDTSATVLGFALDAEEVQVWTDVDGLMTADPRLVPAASTLARVSYAEAAELAFYGARVLHPASIGPALRRETPLRVLNSMRPDGPGTVVHGDVCASDQRPIAAVASRDGVALARFSGRRFGADRALPARALRELSREGLVPDTFVATEVAFSAVVRAGTDLQGLEARLDGAAQIELLDDRVIICVVGSGLAEDAGCRESVLAALSEFGPELIALGASRSSATAVFPRPRLEQVVRGLHRRFFEEAGA